MAAGFKITEAMDETEALRLASEHLASLDGVVIERHKTVDVLVNQATVDGALEMPLHPEMTRAQIEAYAADLRTNKCPIVARHLIQVASAPQLVCHCTLGQYCPARVMLHYGSQLKRLGNMADGMRLLDCCWWVGDAQRTL